MSAFRLGGALLGASLGLYVATARADAIADFYSTHPLTFVIGSSSGGTYDTTARVVARFLPKYLPGNPATNLQNMPGASHVRATDYLANLAARDGSAIAFVQPSVILNKVTSPTAKYDPAAMTWIGRVAPARNVGFAVTASGATTVEAVRSHELILGAAGSTGPAAMVPWALNRMIGAKFKLVRGYTDDTATFLAVERGEVMGMGSINLASIVRHGDWISRDVIRLLYTISNDRLAASPQTPTIAELVEKPRDKAVMRLIAAIPHIGVTIMGAPGVPADRAAALREAARRMFADPDFRAEMKKLEIDVEPMSGEDLAAAVREVMGTPRETVEYLQQQTAPMD
jgi:tripartite-type tricarboxylate transporter receptor subunit TctC